MRCQPIKPTEQQIVFINSGKAIKTDNQDMIEEPKLNIRISIVKGTETENEEGNKKSWIA